MLYRKEGVEISSLCLDEVPNVCFCHMFPDMSHFSHYFEANVGTERFLEFSIGLEHTPLQFLTVLCVRSIITRTAEAFLKIAASLNV